MSEAKAAVKKPEKFITKTLNNLVAGFIKWVSTMTITIVISSLIFASVADGCRFDSGTMSDAKHKMSTAFEWWADGMYKFADLLERLSDALY